MTPLKRAAAALAITAAAVFALGTETGRQMVGNSAGVQAGATMGVAGSAQPNGGKAGSQGGTTKGVAGSAAPNGG